MFKRSLAFLLIISLTSVVAPAMAEESAAQEKYISLPPASLAQWYKPANKRHVWLHTMFNLRREMQAIAWYAERQDSEFLKKWTDKFAKHYRSIGEMVPEWSDELDLDQLNYLIAAAESRSYARVKPTLKKLGQTCRSCHGEYRAIVAATYRAPDFDNMMVASPDGEESYIDNMIRLTALVNQIKISSGDGFYDVAKDSLQQLRVGLDNLGETCSNCHKESEPKERFLGTLTQGALSDLDKALDQQDLKKSGRSLGGLAVYSCARCHSVHRTLTDLKKFIE
ncbi:MAG: cytochrome c [Chromatiales bacterium]|nr:cytochrome c [Chromatiales bacterium]